MPLYVFSKEGEKIPNLNKEIWQEINSTVGGTSPENILDYVYAYLFSPSYRNEYKEFLKTDFPHVPFPKYKEEFWSLVSYGAKLRGLHLLTSPLLKDSSTTFSIAGSNLIDKIEYKNNNIYINNVQFFGNVPKIAWDFYIGGYQPLQKWLKDRKGKILSSNDIEHYQKIVLALVETDKVMKEIDKILYLE